MNTRNRSAAWAFAIIACLVLTITAAQTATFSNINISANWNVVTAYGNGTGYGDIRFQPGSPYVKRASGNDTVIFQSGAIDRSGSGALINVNEVMDSVVVLSTGVFYAAANADSLTAILADTDPTDRIVGSITDTSASALFYAVRLAAGGTDDLFVGMKQAGGLSTTSMMGRPGMDTFIGVFMNENPNGTGFVQGLYLFFRPAETFVAAAHINQGQTFPADTMTAGLLRPTSAPGRAEFLPDSTLTLQQAGNLAMFFDTSMVYQATFTADTTFAMIIRDTNPVRRAADHQSLLAMMVRPDVALDTADLFGSYQAATLRTEISNGQPSLNAAMVFFEFNGNGAGTYDNGEAFPDHFIDSQVTYVITNDSVAGLYPQGADFFKVTFKADSSTSITARFYSDSNNRVFVMSGITDTFVGMGAKRANSITQVFAFGVADTPIQSASLKVGLKIELGATQAPPKFAFSELDTKSAIVSSFTELRDATLIALGAGTVVGVFTVTPDTYITDFDSIIITIDLSGTGLDEAKSDLIPVVFNDSTGVWERVVADSIVSQTTGVVSYNPPHFSTHGAIAAISSITDQVGPDLCVLNSLMAHHELGRVLPSIRGIREVILENTIGRYLVSLYYSIFSVFSAMGIVLLLGVSLTAAVCSHRIKGKQDSTSYKI